MGAMSDNLNALLGLDRYDELRREADAERIAKGARGPIVGLRIGLARTLVRLAILLVQGLGPRAPQTAP